MGGGGTEIASLKQPFTVRPHRNKTNTRRRSVVEHPLMVVGSIPHGGPVEPVLHDWCSKEGRKCFYLTTHSTPFIYGYMASDMW